jgi:hypothetical protein
MSPGEKAFVELREKWFNSHIKTCSHEREWEDEEASIRRKLYNEEMKRVFDKDTEAILNGEDRPVAPYCANDFLCE